MLILLAFTANMSVFAQDSENTVEYEAYPGWANPNDGASAFWVGFLTPGTEEKTYKMSSFQFYQGAGYGSQECYTAISMSGPTGAGAVLSADDVLAVSTNSNNPDADGYYTYNLEEEIELVGNTMYYMVFIASNEPNDENMYTVQTTRVRLLKNASYPAGVMLGNSNVVTAFAPGFKATLTMSDLDYALIRLSQIVERIAFDAGDYTADVPGGYPSELIMACEEAYITAQDMVDNGSDDIDEINLTITNLENAYAALLAGRIPVPFNAGNYYLVSARIGTTNNYVEDASDLSAVDAMYSDGDHAVWSTDFDATIQGEEAEPAYIWQVEEAGTDDDNNTLYTIKNYGYDMYIGNVTSASTPYTFTASADDAAKFVVNGSDPVTGFVTFTNTAITGANNSLHAATSGQAVVNWTAEAAASAWTVAEVTNETLALMGDKCQELRAAYQQRMLNDTLAYYYDKAVAAREAGRSWIFDGTNDGQFIVGDGLVIDSTQVWVYPADPSENNIPGLFDGVFNGTSFIHTSWHATTQGTEPHFIQLDLGEEVQTLVLKYAVRSNAGTPDIPYIVTMYGTNDKSLLSTDTDTIPSTEWTNLGTYTMNWQHPLLDAEGNVITVAMRNAIRAVVENGEGCGITTFELPAAYKYIRMAVNYTVKSPNSVSRTNGDGFNYWCLSELRAYSGEYDPNCVYANMDEDAKNELESSISAAAQELSDTLATQETIDRLKAAYEAFMAIYPDKSKLQAVIDEAQTFIDAAVEGEEIGNYASGSKTTYQAIVTEAQDVADGVLTYTAYNEALTNLSNGYKAFAASLVLPTTGYYNIQSLTTGRAKEAYLVARTTSTTNYRANNGLAWNYAGENAADYVNTLWYVEKLDNGKFTFKNVATGYYMDNTQTTLSGGIAQVTEPTEIALRSARDSSGIGLNFIINEEKGLFGNADPSAGFVVWTGATGNDNSAWTFQPADYQGTMTIKLDKPVSIHTLPFEVMSVDNAYTVAGISTGGASVALNTVSSNIPAGTPFIIVADTATVKTVQAFLTANTAEDIAYVREPLTVNGLVGTLEPDTIDETCLVMNTASTELIYASTSRYQAIAANSGYFVWSALQALDPSDGDSGVVLPLTEDLVNGIENVVIEPVAGKREGVFTIQGQRVNNTRNLPAGVYIVNGSKVLVK